jgi:RNA polymerase sigma factor (sigma-70 family)
MIMSTHLADGERVSDLIDLVDAARDGDEASWAELVTRYDPLIASITRRYRISAMDAVDVNQTVWLMLLIHLGGLRDARALPGWIATTTSRACLDVIAQLRRIVTIDPAVLTNPTGRRVDGFVGTTQDDRAEIDAALQRQEYEQAIRAGLAELSPAQRELLGLLMVRPRLPYSQISQRLGIPVGSIGPTRARCLKKLSRTGAIRRLTAGERLSAIKAVV